MSEQAALSYAKEHRERFIEELKEVLCIPSISSKPEHRKDLYRALEWLQKHLHGLGVEQTAIYETITNPVLFAEKKIDDTLPTLLIYGHMDVMPVEPMELWKSDPFSPVVREGRIYARGANDDKGQAFIQLKAFEAVSKTETLACNVKFLFETEEEVGSKGIIDFCQGHKELLKADAIIVSDTTMLSEKVPSITTGLRGLTFLEIEMTGANRDLHSGHYGGCVANPCNELCRLLGELVDANGKITVPHFYDKVVECSPEERQRIAQTPYDEEEYKRDLGIRSVQGEKGYSTLERGGIRPTCDINGIWGGYTGEGAKTIVPSKAYAKLSFRLVPNQSSEEITALVKEYLMEKASPGVVVEVTPLHGGEPYVTPIDLPVYHAAERAYEKTFGKKPIPQRAGGSIGIVPAFEEILGVKTLLMGFGLEEDRIHSPNESFSLEMFAKGIETVIHFFQIYPQLFSH